MECDGKKFFFYLGLINRCGIVKRQHIKRKVHDLYVSIVEFTQSEERCSPWPQPLVLEHDATLSGSKNFSSSF